MRIVRFRSETANCNCFYVLIEFLEQKILQKEVGVYKVIVKCKSLSKKGLPLSLNVNCDEKVKAYYKAIEDDIGRQLMEEFENNNSPLIDSDFEDEIENQIES